MTAEPISLSSERAQRSGAAKDWTVRDALEYALASLDDPDHVIAPSTRCVLIFGTVKDDGGIKTQVIAATRNRFERDGLIAGALTE